MQKVLDQAPSLDNLHDKGLFEWALISAAPEARE
jgi:hypothetical protein